MVKNSYSDRRWARRLVCTRSDAVAPLDEPAFLSPVGAPWRVEYELDPGLGASWRRSLTDRPWGLWRYRELLPVADWDARVDLGAGGTPLVRAPGLAPEGVELRIKEEGGNPTGSFKARGLALAITRARELGASGVELASAGNAAAAMTAYAAAADLPARVALPEETPPVLVDRCRLHGAEVLRGGETLVEARDALAEDPKGYWDLSTFREPYRVEGKKTMGLELAEQLGWDVPEWILYPTGGGTGIVGMASAFRQLRALGILGARLPRLVVVQMEGCAPLVRAWERGREEAEPWEEIRTRVWGLRVPEALADFLVLRAVRESEGVAVTVTEEERKRAVRAAGRRGVLFGPEGGAALAGVGVLERMGELSPGDRVVVFQTGHPANYGDRP
ncbi:MAG: threonine synthase [Thermoanaerobaculia bacterium]|nr:threonine synthase [Thermoanaerobaculia bacterium]